VKQLLRWGVLATALVIGAGGLARAQLPGQSLPATKVGVVNLGVLFIKYEKSSIYKKELETELAPLKASAEKIKDAMTKHNNWLKDPRSTDAKQRETSEGAMRDGQRALEDLDLQARKLVGKKQENQLIQLYKEIHAAVQTHAQNNGFHVILAYGDPPDQDLFTFQNINRKMGAMDMGAAVPYYWQTNLDVTNDVLVRLNSNYHGAGGVGAAQSAVPGVQTSFPPPR